MNQTRIQVLKEVKKEFPDRKKANLCLQWCLYVYEEGNYEHGYRFIWRKPNGHLQAARGQAVIPSLKIAEELMQMAREAGWSNLGEEGEK